MCDPKASVSVSVEQGRGIDEVAGASEEVLSVDRSQVEPVDERMPVEGARITNRSVEVAFWGPWLEEGVQTKAGSWNDQTTTRTCPYCSR